MTWELFADIGCLRRCAATRRGTATLRSELIERLAELHPHLRYRDVGRVVEAIFEEIGAALARGTRIELRGFGSFANRHREARTARNPNTGAIVEVPRRRSPYFKISKLLHARLNEER
jgi:integration host factor subunit beta